MGVKVMGAVYEQSWLTIVAASGHDANAGLPGIQNNSRFAIHPSRITGFPINPPRIDNELYMDIFVPLDRLLRRSVYSSRAWTFQEQLLARRAVYFIDNQIFFRCTDRIYSEHVFDQPSQGGDDIFSWASMLQGTAAMESPLFDFQLMLLYYTPRALTDQNDILRALTGVIRRVSERAKCTFLQGLPTAAFDAFVTFQAHNGLTRRRKGFPSYSWAGWKGGVCADKSDNMFRDLNKWLEEETWIAWYKRSLSGALSLVWDPAAGDSIPSDDRTYAGYGRRRRFKAPQAATGLFLASARTHPTGNLSFDMSPFPYPLLQFWSLSVNFKLCPDDVFTGSACIIDRFGKHAGKIILDGLDERTFNWQGVVELVLLSGVVTRAIQQCRNTDDPTPRYWVMLLEWKGRVAERRGMDN